MNILENFRRLVIAVLILFLSACSYNYSSQETPLQQVSLEQIKSNQQELWWRVRFRFHWPEDENLDFSYHLLIADQILKPIIDKHKDQLTLWRFHRRAARDNSGHQFSFIFYTTEEIAGEINNRIEDHSIVNQLKLAKVLEVVRFTNPKKDQASQVESQKIEATSDPIWPIEVQKSWPVFIQGVSQSWLDFIHQEQGDDYSPDFSNIQQMLDFYRGLDQRITDKWGLYGRHAYFHHINGLFGYSPVYIQESNQWYRF